MKKHLLVISLMFVAFAGAIAQRTISGTVSDAGGETLIGASILVKGTSTGTITDFDGTYSLEVPEGATTLVFSYTGYSSCKIFAAPKASRAHTSISPNRCPPNCALPPNGCWVINEYGPIDLACILSSTM
jgi:hypothetical protein